MPEIRPYRPDDLDMLYRICLETGDAGKDATHLYNDPKILGHVYAAPYAIFSPETVSIAADEQGAAGYIVGPVDTAAFDARMEKEWWATLRPTLVDPKGKPYETWSRDERMAYRAIQPSAIARSVSRAFSSACCASQACTFATPPVTSPSTGGQ